jgi:hypothetical protein
MNERKNGKKEKRKKGKKEKRKIERNKERKKGIRSRESISDPFIARFSKVIGRNG